VRISVQLVDSDCDKHIWGEHYDRELTDIFEVQDDVVHCVAGTLVGRLEHRRQELARKQSQSELKAYDMYLRGREHFFNYSSDDNRKAGELLETAVEIEPNYAAALALLSEVYNRNWLNGWSLDGQKDLLDSHRMAARAVAIDDSDSRTHTAMALACLFKSEFAEARDHFETALRLNPNDTRVLAYYSRHAVLAGEPRQGIEMIHRALHLNPFGKYNTYLGSAEFVARHYDEAVDRLRNVRDPSPTVLALLAASFAQLDRTDEAKSTCEHYLIIAKSTPMLRRLQDVANWRDFFVARWPFRREEDLEHLLASLRKGGIPV
jgi:Tfp pilus assembly protein PilF